MIVHARLMFGMSMNIYLAIMPLIADCKSRSLSFRINRNVHIIVLIDLYTVSNKSNLSLSIMQKCLGGLTCWAYH